MEQNNKARNTESGQRAIEIAAENHLNAYDSLYVAACKSNNAPLLTFDDGIIKRADVLDIQLL